MVLLLLDLEEVELVLRLHEYAVELGDFPLQIDFLRRAVLLPEDQLLLQFVVLLVLRFVELQQLELSVEVVDVGDGLLLAGVFGEQRSVLLTDLLQAFDVVLRLLLWGGRRVVGGRLAAGLHTKLSSIINSKTINRVSC